MKFDKQVPQILRFEALVVVLRQTPTYLFNSKNDNRGDGIRTHDLYVPNVALYQTEPRPDDQQSIYYQKDPASVNLA